MTFNYVVMYEYDIDGHTYQESVAHKVEESNNLLTYIKVWQNLGAILIHQCKTYKNAKEIANAWNQATIDKDMNPIMDSNRNSRSREIIDKCLAMRYM